MKCPKYRIAMNNRVMQDVAVDECPQCKSIWFDQGELDKVKDEISPDLRWMDFDLWKKEGDFRVAPQLMNCPKCFHNNLRALHYAGGEVTILSRL
jgi:hypothetical protein